MIKRIKKYKYYLSVIVCSLMVIIAAYILKEVTPFGKYSLLTIDFFHQYGPMLGELYRRIYNGNSLLYSFNMGLGLPFFRNYFNYLSSPFNILLLFYKQSKLLTSYSVIIGLKAVASAIVMAIFFKWKFGEKNRLIPLCILYAFSAYYVAYYWNIMWIDGMYMLPLVTLGIEKLVKENKSLLYIISLAIMLYINYFIGYMICIFSVLYFIMYLILITPRINYKKILKKVINFGISSLMAGCLCAFFLVPLFLALRTTSATGGTLPIYSYYPFTIKEFLFSHFSGVNSTVLKSDGICSPNISCGIVSIALCLLFWLNNRISVKTKLCYTLLLGILIISFIFAPFDYVWHGMHVPNDLPFRYSFIYSFILIIISAYSVVNIEKIKLLYVTIVYIVCIILSSLLKIFNYQGINDMMIILNLVVITIFYLCYAFYLSHKKWGKWLLTIILLTTVTERVMVINNNWSIDQETASFYKDDEIISKVIHYLNHEEEDMFYRMEKSSFLTLNDSEWYGYNGAGVFSSMEYENVARLLSNLGTGGNQINSYYYKVNTPIYDMMFDIKYLIGDIKSTQYNFYTKIDDLIINKNKYNLGLMYGVNKEILNYKVEDQNPFLNQNNFIKYASGTYDVLKPIESIYKQEVYHDDKDHYIVKYIVLGKYDNYYLYLPSISSCADFVIFNNDLYYFNEDYDYLDNYSIGYSNVYDSIERHIIEDIDGKSYLEFYVGYTNFVDNYLDLYTFDMDKYLQAYNYLKGNKVTITNFKENMFEGNIDALNDCVIYTSIPYDNGWKVYIDNKSVETFKVGDALLSFNMPKGKHTIKLKYHIPYMWLGIIIDILVIIGYIIYKRKKA